MWNILNVLFSVIFYGAILIVAIVVIYNIYVFLKPKIEEGKRRELYKSEIESKYKRFSNDQKKMIYREIISINEACMAGKKAGENAKKVRGKQQRDLLVQALVPSMKVEEFEKRYKVKLNKEYIMYDIEYLQQFI